MEINDFNPTSKRICKICLLPLADNSHGNRKSHKECVYQGKLLQQKRKYKIGNSAKLMIQKNEVVAAQLLEMDKQKKGIPYTIAMEMGFKFNCPSKTLKHQNETIFMFDNYGYRFETINKETFIFIYHESELI